MLLRRKFCKATAIAIAAISVFGSEVKTVNAYEGANQIAEISQQLSKSVLQNGEYKLKNIIKKDNVKPYRGFLSEETKLVVKDGKYYLTFTNTNVGSVPEIKVKVNGREVTPTIENVDDITYKFVVELDNLDDQITMNSLMVAMNHNLEFEIGLDMDSIEVVKLDESQEIEQPETPQEPQQPQQPEQSEEKEDIEQSKSQNSEYKNGFYKLKNAITDHTMPNMIRNLLGEETTVEIRDGKTYVTFNIPNYDYVGNITVTVDGKIVTHSQENSKTYKTAQFKIEVPSLDSTIKMTIYSTVTKKDSVFGVTLDKSSMEFVSENQAPSQSTNNTTNGTTSNNSNTTTNNSSNLTSDVTVENVVAKGTRYTIKNEVTAESTTSKKMGRNYLNETSTIEEVDGKTYAVLTFTGLNMMNNHRIYVNGSKVTHQVVSKTSDSVTVRFLISSVDTDIKVEVFVVPMNFDSEFNVKLLKGTEGLKEEFDTTSSLPQTGSLLDSSVMMMAGTVISTGGLLLNRKKKKNRLKNAVTYCFGIFSFEQVFLNSNGVILFSFLNKAL